MSREDNWMYDVVEEEKPKLQPLLDTLRRLRQRGLTAAIVAAAFHHQRVSLEGSRMLHETLPLDEVARRARWMVGSFKQEDIDRVPMRPT
jgi:hypothetical protein